MKSEAKGGANENSFFVCLFFFCVCELIIIHLNSMSTCEMSFVSFRDPQKIFGPAISI